MNNSLFGITENFSLMSWIIDSLKADDRRQEEEDSRGGWKAAAVKCKYAVTPRVGKRQNWWLRILYVLQQEEGFFLGSLALSRPFRRGTKSPQNWTLLTANFGLYILYIWKCFIAPYLGVVDHKAIVDAHSDNLRTNAKLTISNFLFISFPFVFVLV